MGGSSKQIRVEVVYATPEKQVLRALDVDEGATVVQAIALSGIGEEFDNMELKHKQVGIFSQKVSLDHVLRQGDRIEIYRPLIADPKQVRRERAEKAKKKAT
jgi:putative ubiquitin-RnfH superfamily antitoxin RatB of RatAB toxin-antitoxin module